MTTTELVIVIGAADIAVHFGITVCVGMWLNKMARREVERAAENIATGLVSRFPILAPFAESARETVRD